MKKYSMYRKERSLEWQENRFISDNWEYNREEKYYICPYGKCLAFGESKKRKTGSGYPVTVEKYEYESCKYRRLKKQCTKAKWNRTVERNERWLRLKRKARWVPEDGRYIELRKRRPVEVETVFGPIKGNRGIQEVSVTGNRQSLNRTGFALPWVQFEADIPYKPG